MTSRPIDNTIDNLSAIPETAPLVDNVTFIYIPISNTLRSCDVFKYGLPLTDSGKSYILTLY